jgi:hypothetical protein
VWRGAETRTSERSSFSGHRFLRAAGIARGTGKMQMIKLYSSRTGNDLQGVQAGIQ